MIAGKVNQAQNVIILPEIKKRKKKEINAIRFENRAAARYCKLRHFVKQIKRFNDMCTRARATRHTQIQLYVSISVELHVLFNNIED